MVSSSIIVSLIFIFIVVLIFYKRDLFIKMFVINLTSQTSRFQEQLEETGDLVIKRLEEQIVHLEYLLEEANEKINSLEHKIQTTTTVLSKEHEEYKEYKKYKENAYIHLEELFERANEKMISLDHKIEIANKILDKEHNEKMDTRKKLIEVNHVESVKKELTDLNIDLYHDMPRKDKRNLIIEMTDLGYDITEIAKATGISKGEIMLLLQLNKENLAYTKP